MALTTLTSASFGHVINAPIGSVDVSDWLRNLTSSEYRRLAPAAHIAAGASPTDDGERIWVQVEMIGVSLLVHQYVGESMGDEAVGWLRTPTCSPLSGGAP